MCLYCESCEYKNTEIKAGNKINEFGRRITINVNSEQELKKDLYKSSSCTVLIPEYEFEYKT